MKQFVRRLLKIFILGVCLGFGMIFVQWYLKMDTDEFMPIFLRIALVVIIGSTLISIAYFLFYWERMRRLIKLLRSGQAAEYTEGMEKLLRTAKGKYLREILRLNLAAGYAELEQYSMALNIMEDLAVSGLRGSALKQVLGIDLFICYFKTTQYEKAMETYREYQPIFCKCRCKKPNGGYMALVDIMAAIINEDYARADSLLDEAMKTYKEPDIQADLLSLSGMVDSNLNHRS